MMTRIAAAALAAALGQPALAQAQDQQQPPPQPRPGAQVEGQATHGMAVETGAVGQEVFVATRQEYHVLASELVGRQVEVAAAPDGEGMQQTAPTGGQPGAQPGQEAQPAGEITDVLLDRTGATQGIVIALDAERFGSEHEVAVLIDMVELVAECDDPARTHLQLNLNAADLQSAPPFQR